VIDAHQHVWAPGPDRYTWIPRGHQVLDEVYTHRDLVTELSQRGIQSTVLVQAEDSLDDTWEMLAVAAAEPTVGGVVGWLPLHEPRDFAAAVEELSTNSWLVGIRHATGQPGAREWILGHESVRSLRELASLGLSLDLVTSDPIQLSAAIEVATRHPELHVVLDHLASPPIEEQGWEPWAALLREAAKRPNVSAKVSGMCTSAGGGLRRPAELLPYVSFALEVFGAGRLMYGGDWPVALVGGSYREVFETTTAVLSDLSDSEKDHVFHSTAAEVYGMR